MSNDNIFFSTAGHIFYPYVVPVPTALSVQNAESASATNITITGAKRAQHSPGFFVSDGDFTSHKALVFRFLHFFDAFFPFFLGSSFHIVCWLTMCLMLFLGTKFENITGISNRTC